MGKVTTTRSRYFISKEKRTNQRSLVAIKTGVHFNLILGSLPDPNQSRYANRLGCNFCSRILKFTR